MQDSNARKPDEPISGSDATSKETLEDLEESEQDSESKDAPSESDVPSPDGVDDESRKADDAGPM
jgi:hypothetical protein